MIGESEGGFILGCILSALAVVYSAFTAQFFSSFMARNILVFAVIVRVILIFLSYYGVLFPLQMDNYSFHVEAFRLSTGASEIELSIADSKNYPIFLSLFYGVFGPSSLIMTSLSLFPFIAGAAYFAKLLRTMGATSGEKVALLAFSFAPSSLLFNNYGCREAYMVAFAILAVNQAIAFRRTGNPIAIVLVCLFGWLFGVFHNRFLVIIPMILVVISAYPSPTARKSINVFGIIVQSVFGVAAAAGFYVLMQGMDFLTSVEDSGVLGVAARTQELGLSLAARTQLPWFVSSSSPEMFLLFLPQLLVQGMLAPIIPPVVSETQDLLAIIDTLTRTFFFYGAIRTFVFGAPMSIRLKSDGRAMLCIYILALFMIILGTTTVGTLMRHQMKYSWILLILGAPYVASFFRRSAAPTRTPI